MGAQKYDCENIRTLSMENERRINFLIVTSVQGHVINIIPDKVVAVRSCLANPLDFGGETDNSEIILLGEISYMVKESPDEINEQLTQLHFAKAWYNLEIEKTFQVEWQRQHTPGDIRIVHKNMRKNN